MKHMVLLFLLLTLPLLTANAKDSVVVTARDVHHASPMSVRAEFGLARNNVSFTRLPGVQSCCTDFIGAQGVSASLSASLRLLTLSPTLTLQATASGSLLTSPMSTITQEIVDYRGDAYDATIRHDLAMRYWFAQASIDASFAPTKWLSLSIGVGGALPVALDYSIRETMMSPDQLVFETGTTARNQQRGSSPSAQFALYVPITLEGPSLNLGRELVVQPLLSVQQYLNSLNSSTQWRTTAIRGGIKLSLHQVMVELDTQRISDPNHEQIPITDIPPEYIPQKITLKAGVRDTISNTYLEQVDISYNVKRRRLAMLPSVFFDSAQAAIPTRFLQRRVFDDSSMSKGIRDIDVSHSILHVLGSTMQRQPGATVTITGCHAEDVAPEERNRLARARADAVKTHLTSRYGIDSSRVRVLTRAFPERASSVFTPFGRAENRRVDLELQETSYDLPVQSDTLVVASPPKIETLIETTRPESIKKLRVALLADGVEMAAIDTNAAANLVSSPFVLTDSVKRRLLQAKHVEVAVEAQDEIEGSVQQRVSAFNVLARPDEEQPFDEFGIVLFDYNSSRIAESELDVLEDLRARVARADRITITGTSDESGVESENLRLAQERAQTVARALGLKPGMYVLESRIATDYSSYIPEGRMLGRQVKVVLQTGK